MKGSIIQVIGYMVTLVNVSGQIFVIFVSIKILSYEKLYSIGNSVAFFTTEC
jgi:hypothetical protein